MTMSTLSRSLPGSARATRIEGAADPRIGSQHLPRPTRDGDEDNENLFSELFHSQLHLLTHKPQPTLMSNTNLSELRQPSSSSIITYPAHYHHHSLAHLKNTKQPTTMIIPTTVHPNSSTRLPVRSIIELYQSQQHSGRTQEPIIPTRPTTTSPQPIIYRPSAATPPLLQSSSSSSSSYPQHPPRPKTTPPHSNSTPPTNLLTPKPTRTRLTSLSPQSRAYSGGTIQPRAKQLAENCYLTKEFDQWLRHQKDSLDHHTRPRAPSNSSSSERSSTRPEDLLQLTSNSSSSSISSVEETSREPIRRQKPKPMPLPLIQKADKRRESLPFINRRTPPPIPSRRISSISHGWKNKIQSNENNRRSTEKYIQLWKNIHQNQIGCQKLRCSGVIVRGIWKRSGLNEEQLFKIWEEIKDCKTETDGKISYDSFIDGMIEIDRLRSISRTK